MRKLLAQESRRCALETVDDFSDGSRRITLDEQVNMIRHDFQLVNEEIVLQRHFADQLLEPFVYWRHQYGPSVLRAPHHVIFEAENSPGIACISRSRLSHAELCKRREDICQHKKKGHAFTRLLKQTVPCTQN